MSENLKNLFLVDLFGRLGTAEGAELEDVTAELRKRLDNPVSIQSLTNAFRPFVVGGLSHPRPQVKEFALSQLARWAAKEQGTELLQSADVLPLVVKSLEDEHLGVVNQATKTLLALARQTSGEDIIFTDSTLALFDGMVKSDNDIVSLRVLDFFAELSLVLPSTYQRARRFLQLIVEKMQVDDLLQRLNIMEMLEKIVKSEEGIRFLGESGVLGGLHDILKASGESVDPLLASAILRLFAQVARKDGAEVSGLVRSLGLLPTVSVYLNGEEPSTAEAAITLVGAIGSTGEGLGQLLGQEKLLRDWFEYFTSSQQLFKLSFLHAFAELLSCKDEEQTYRVYKIEDSGWEGNSSGEVLRTLMKYVDQPFPDIRNSAFAVFKEIAGHPRWGVEALVNFPTFFEFILNRNTETTKVGREWKYSILEALVKGKTAEELEHVHKVLGVTKQRLVERYLREGPFYAVAESATEVGSKAG
jgi:26S proteasome non-ATPase regulatory subunit 5